MAEEADRGRPVVIAAPESQAAKALSQLADTLHRQIGGKTFALPILRG
jgi:MinD-like ATPase involved in chromosome partitioning or flagellar assembly